MLQSEVVHGKKRGFVLFSQDLRIVVVFCLEDDGHGTGARSSDTNKAIKVG